MAKREQSQNSPQRRFPLFLLFILFIVAGWWLWQNDQFMEWTDRVLQYVDNRDILTVEARFLPEQILEDHHQELLGDDKYTLQKAGLRYYPYLLLDVKYTDDHKTTREGVLLWGLHDGEMVLNTENWETTHGFRDCLDCHATRHDFKIIQALARHQGSLSVEELQKELHLEREGLAPWIEETKQKHLVIQKGNLLQLHFENPKLLVTPQTRIKQHLVSKPIGDGQKMPKTYSRTQITSLAQAAFFGKDFKIRDEQEVFLPVYRLEILNPDGSTQISEWNALTGQRLVPRYLSKN